MKLDLHITQLLLRHDCLIIPDFGGFVTRNSSAIINWEKGQIQAPSKEVVFNVHLQKNDGLLVNYVADIEAISYISAGKKIQTKVSDWKKAIQQGNRVEIEKVGILYKDNAGNIQFEQDRFFNLLLDSFGLSNLTFIPQAQKEQEKTIVSEKEQIVPKKETPIIAIEHAKTREKEVVAEFLQKEIIPEKQIVNRHFPWKYLAAACILPIGFFAYWIPMQTPVLATGKIAIADFNPFRKTTEVSYSPKNLTYIGTATKSTPSIEEQTKNLSADVSVFNYQFSDELYIPIRLHETAKNVVKVSISTDNNFHLIGGCFASKQNAENFIEECTQKGLNAFVLDTKNRLYRVSVGQFSSSEQAQSNKSLFTEKGIQTWMLRK